MDETIKKAIVQAVKTEPLAQAFQMQLIKLNLGHSIVEMVYNPEVMNNIYARAHGGAIYALIDEAFETAGQTDGTIAVAMNVNVTYVASPEAGTLLRAEAKKVSCTKRTASYDIKVTDGNGQLIANCQALAYRTRKPIPFL